MSEQPPDDQVTVDNGRRLIVPPTLRTTALAIVLALAAGAVLVVITDDGVRRAAGYVFARPGDTFRAAWDAVAGTYGALLRGSFGSGFALSETLLSATPLVLTGLAVAVPFRAGLFNIGAEGQVIAGGTAAGLVGFSLTGLPLVVHLPLALLAGLFAGLLVGALPGVLKARTGAHEVITTIMLNNIAALVLADLLVTTLFQQPGRDDPISRRVLDTASLPSLPGRARLDAGLLVALLVAAAVWWYVERSTRGFELRAVGANPAAATSAGMSVPRTTVVAMSVAGAVAGLGGAGLVLGTGGQGAITAGFSSGVGFDGITVALLGRGKVAGTIGAAVVLGALKAGGRTMQASTGVPLDLVTVIQALIILFVAAPVLVEALFRLRRSTEAASGVAKGWGA